MERKTSVVTQRSALCESLLVGLPKRRHLWTERSYWGWWAAQSKILLARPDSQFCVVRTCTFVGVGPLWEVLGPLDGLNISVACCDWKFNWYPQQRHVFVFFLLLDDWWRIGYQLSAWWWLHVLTFLRGTQISWNMCLNNQSSVTIFFSEHVCHGVGFSLFLILGNYIFIIF